MKVEHPTAANHIGFTARKIAPVIRKKSVKKDVETSNHEMNEESEAKIRYRMQKKQGQ